MKSEKEEKNISNEERMKIFINPFVSIIRRKIHCDGLKFFEGKLFHHVDLRENETAFGFFREFRDSKRCLFSELELRAASTANKFFDNLFCINFTIISLNIVIYYVILYINYSIIINDFIYNINLYKFL